MAGANRLRLATIRAIGKWNSAWDPFWELDPVWTDQYFAAGAYVYQSGLSAKDAELLMASFDASYTHMYAPGTRRHIKGALEAGATKLCVVQGVQGCNLGIELLEKPAARRPRAKTSAAKEAGVIEVFCAPPRKSRTGVVEVGVN